MTAADDDMTDRLGVAPMPSSVDPPGTCHRVGCPRKGEHPPHTFIGAPNSFAPYDAPTLDRPGQTTVATSLLVRADSLLQAFVRGRIVSTTTVEPSMIEEAQLLSEAFRKATSGAGR